MYVQRRARFGPVMSGSRVVLLCGSQVVVGCLSKGRSKWPALNDGLRKLLAYSLASKLYLTCIWVPTGANPADAPLEKNTSSHGFAPHGLPQQTAVPSVAG